jgi:hypothetical protein
MPILRGSGELLWRVHLEATPPDVFALLSTDHGRQTFWAEKSATVGNEFVLTFPDLSTIRVVVRVRQHPHVFEIEYFGSVTRFVLQPAGERATDLQVTASEVAPNELVEVAAGWVSVLLALKSMVNFGNDLRNHERARTWADGYVDN